MTVKWFSIKLVKIVILLAAAYFLFSAVVEGGAQAMSAVSTNNWHLIVGILIVAIAAMTWIAFIWVMILRYLEVAIGFGLGISIYFVGESSKYLPGALWAVLGRAELAHRHGVPRSGAYTSALLSLLYNFVLSALLASLLVAPIALSTQMGSLTPLWLLALLPIGILLLHPRLISIGIHQMEKLTKRNLAVPILPWKTSILFVLSYLPAWFMVGLATWLAAQAVGAETGFFLLMFSMCLAWAAGFLAIPAPSGLGVREAIFITLMAITLSDAMAASVALLTRVAFIFTDALGAMVGLVALKLLDGMIRSEARND